tara:strand:- start:33523 stop:33783 length:261 start_codon:yes stop_codon:yes gene_type:complete
MKSKMLLITAIIVTMLIGCKTLGTNKVSTDIHHNHLMLENPVVNPKDSLQYTLFKPEFLKGSSDATPRKMTWVKSKNGTWKVAIIP